MSFNSENHRHHNFEKSPHFSPLHLFYTACIFLLMLSLICLQEFQGLNAYSKMKFIISHIMPYFASALTSLLYRFQILNDHQNSSQYF